MTPESSGLTCAGDPGGVVVQEAVQRQLHALLQARPPGGGKAQVGRALGAQDERGGLRCRAWGRQHTGPESVGYKRSGSAGPIKSSL
jgi:hypothetical protein